MLMKKSSRFNTVTVTIITLLILSMIIVYFLKQRNKTGFQKQVRKIYPIVDMRKRKTWIAVPNLQGEEIYHFLSKINGLEYVNNLSNSCPDEKEISLLESYLTTYEIVLKKESTQKTYDEHIFDKAFIGLLCDIFNKCSQSKKNIKAIINQLFNHSTEDISETNTMGNYAAFLRYYKAYGLMDEVFIDKIANTADKKQWLAIMDAICAPGEDRENMIPILQKVLQANELNYKKVKDIQQCITIINSTDPNYQLPNRFKWEYAL